MNIRERAKKLKTDIPAVFLALKRKDTPLAAKIAAGVTVAYALSPIDLIPDFIPVLGYLDDVIILPALAALTVRLIPKDTMEACRREAEGFWSNGRPKRWYYAIPIILVWLLIVCLIVRAIWLYGVDPCVDRRSLRGMWYEEIRDMVRAACGRPGCIGVNAKIRRASA